MLATTGAILDYLLPSCALLNGVYIALATAKITAATLVRSGGDSRMQIISIPLSVYPLPRSHLIRSSGGYSLLSRHSYE